MELNIEKAKALFPDAIKLQLRINGPATVVDIRRLLPNSTVMLSCKISKNYANVIYSEGAAKRMFPDVSKLSGEVLGEKSREGLGEGLASAHVVLEEAGLSLVHAR